MPFKNNERPNILLLASGFIYLNNSGRNLGDVAQQQSGVKDIQSVFDNPEIFAVANSVNESSELDDTEFTKKQINYLSAPSITGSSILKRVVAVTHVFLLVWNAHRRVNRKGTLLLSKDGQDALDELCNADAMFVSGAGNFNDEYMYGVGLFWATLIKCASILNVPVVLSGQQIGPLDRITTKMMAAWGLKAADVVGVRETISREIACEIGVPANNVVLTGDGAWNLAAESSHDARVLLSSLGIEGSFIAAQFRFDVGTQWTADDASVLGACLDGLSKKFGCSVLFVPMFYGDSGDDRVAADVIGSVMKSKTAFITDQIDAVLTKAVLGEAKVSVGVSNHFCVLSASMGTPTVCFHRSPYLGQKLQGLSKIWPHVISLSVDELLVADDVVTKTVALLNSLPESKGPLEIISEGEFHMQPDKPLLFLKQAVLGE